MLQDTGVRFFDRKNLSIFQCLDQAELEREVEEYTEGIFNETEIFEGLSTLGSTKELICYQWKLLIPYQPIYLEHAVESQPDLFRVIAGQQRLNQLALQTYFVVKYTLIFTEKTLKNLRYSKATGEFFKKKTPDLSIEGETGIKKLKTKKFFTWTDFLIIKPHAWEQAKWGIHDARTHHFHTRLVNDIPNLDLKLPPLFTSEQFAGLKEFIQSQSLYSKIQDKYKDTESLFDLKVDPKKKKNRQVVIVLGHGTEETAKMFLARQS